ncbi:S-crystallin SL11-like [Acanthaster planci]|uniref:S-crystallin SL11-like n=1 Tax=Acanthaster planci TaxID=133434 RepID=A0A8B7Z016_ACAPL|nr:S-crystallin SL11-like [Acanthaster planci]
MPTYRLMYFNNRGRAEVTRLLFKLAGQEFEDVRVPHKDWPTEKSKFPLLQLPVLEIDGQQIPQSRAMAGYLAREFGFHGSDSWQTLMVEVICDTADDLLQPLGDVLFLEKDESRKAEAIKNYYENRAPVILECLEKYLVKNGGGDGFFIGDKISLADISVWVSLDVCFGQRKDILAKYPKLVKLSERVDVISQS